MFDFSNTKPPQEYGALIPDGTIAVVRMNIKPGGIGPGNWFTRAESGSEMLCVEFTILEGEFARRKFFGNLITNGATAGAQSMVETTMQVLGAIINSAFDLDPRDDSPATRAKRSNVEPSTFDGINFLAKIGIEAGKLKDDGSGEKWPDKNRLAVPITKDHPKEWRGPILQNAPCATPSQTPLPLSSQPMSKPEWAK
jgi:hypothetical protein